MSKSLHILRKGLENPTSIPPYLLGRLFPGSRWGPKWYREDGFITFVDGNFAGGTPSRAELSARNFYEATQLAGLLEERSFERSLEIGCGYGRLSGWFAEYAEEAVAVEPNEDAVARAAALYPTIEFHETTADELPFTDDAFDLGFAWAVLSHIPAENLQPTATELRRVFSDDAVFIACVKTRGEAAAASWPRSPAAYEALFAPFELTGVYQRQTEPTFDYGERYDIIVFERP